MFWKAGLRIALVAVVALALLATATLALGAIMKVGGETEHATRLLNPTPALSGGHHSLDTEYNQLRYFKTTDFGVTWGAMQTAGDMSTVNPDSGRLAEFCAVVMNNNQLCYGVILQHANPPGVYAVPGPDFTPHLAMPLGNNIWDTGNQITLAYLPRGYVTIGKTPNGDLFMIAWGHRVSATDTTNTFWGMKSTDGGVNWGTPFIVATAPTLDETCLYPHLAQVSSATQVFFMFQKNGANGTDQIVGRFPVAGGTATLVNVGTSREGLRNYFEAGDRPIDYDPTANVLYAVYWNNAPASNGVSASYSTDGGVTFHTQTAAINTPRYPSVSLRVTDGTPWVLSNVGAGADPHICWAVYDQSGYGGGNWSTPQTIASVPNDGVFGLIYMNQMHWWDANRGMSSHAYWGNTPSIEPAGGFTNYTTDGGVTWSALNTLWYYQTASLEWATSQDPFLAGGTNGTAYVVTSGKIGDTQPPSITNIEVLTPVTQLPPYVVRCLIQDNAATDSSSMTINIDCPRIHADTVYFLGVDSIQHVAGPDPWGGWYYFTIPNPFPEDFATGAVQMGDTINFNINGNDKAGNIGQSYFPYIFVGNRWEGVTAPAATSPNSFKLYPNFPNPFNPSTQISFDLPATDRVSVTVYNTLGQRVAQLADREMMTAGQHNLNFNATGLPSGMYFYRVSTGKYAATQKMVLLK